MVMEVLKKLKKRNRRRPLFLLLLKMVNKSYGLFRSQVEAEIYAADFNKKAEP